MIIKGIAASLPERRVTNEEVIDLVRHYSAKDFSGDLDRTLRIILHLLKRSGLIERRWCGRHESPIDHVAIAVREAMSRSYLRREHIELLIYVGVGRGFLEPGNSHMIASALGFRNAHCFDVVDACMSWIRALNLVDSLFKTGAYRNALVVNAEFHSIPEGPHFPRFLTLGSDEEIPYSFSSLTIGDAATATLLQPKDAANFEFHFSSAPQHSDLCTIPLPGYEEFCHPEKRVGKKGILQFTSYGEEMHRHAAREAPMLLSRVKNLNDLDILFVHGSSKREWTRYSEQVRLQHKVFHVYPEVGNVVSASIPVAITEAARRGALSRGMRAAAWVGSAGMSYGFARFAF